MSRNKELQHQRQREWYQRMKKDLDWVQKRYKENNDWKLENKENIKSYQKKYTAECPWIGVLGHISGRCNNPKNIGYKNYGAKGIKNFLTADDVKYLWCRDKAYELERPSIDRKDSKDHYTLENCRFIELIENISKTWFNSETGRIVGDKGRLAKKLRRNREVSDLTYLESRSPKGLVRAALTSSTMEALSS